MKLRPNPSDLQFNLLLMNSAPIELPADRNEELVHTLVELLLSAAKESVSPNAIGGQNESETDQ